MIAPAIAVRLLITRLISIQTFQQFIVQGKIAARSKATELRAKFRITLQNSV